MTTGAVINHPALVREDPPATLIRTLLHSRTCSLNAAVRSRSTSLVGECIRRGVIYEAEENSNAWLDRRKLVRGT